MNRHLAAVVLLALAPGIQAAVEPQAHYNLKGAGGIRDTACPPTLKDQAGKSPALARQGSPKVMSNGPDSRRLEYDSSIKFEQPDQCYSTPQNLVSGDNFMLETWAYALKANAGGWHAVVANGDGGRGFLLGQNSDHWSVLVGGIGAISLGKIIPGQWTHLAIVKASGRVSGWLNGRQTADLPDLGGGGPNFSIGATAPNKEPFSGWVAEVRHATFQPGKFDPTADFLMDNAGLKIVLAADKARRTQLVESLRYRS